MGGVISPFASFPSDSVRLARKAWVAVLKVSAMEGDGACTAGPMDSGFSLLRRIPAARQLYQRLVRPEGAKDSPSSLMVR